MEIEDQSFVPYILFIFLLEYTSIWQEFIFNLFNCTWKVLCYCTTLVLPLHRLTGQGNSELQLPRLSSLSLSLYYYWGWPFTPNSSITSHDMYKMTLKLRIWPLVHKKVINDIKEDPVLHSSKQEPSMSSKYPCKGPPIFETLLIYLWTQNFQDIFFGVKWYYQWHYGGPCPQSLQSGTLNVLKVSP